MVLMISMFSYMYILYYICYVFCNIHENHCKVMDMINKKKKKKK